MDLEARITFPAGKRVNAEIGGWTIATDQPPTVGGEGTAPDPFTLFAASIGACAGYYVLRFCQSRGLATAQIALRQRLRYDDERLVAIEVEIELPDGFPTRYRDAIVRVAEGCKVKKAIEALPRFFLRTVPAAKI